MRLFDTHAHLHFPELLADLDAVLDRARAAGVAAMVTVGTDRETSQQAPHQSPRTYPTRGIARVGGQIRTPGLFMN